MSSSRKQFLTAAGLVGAGLVTKTSAVALSPTPTPSPPPSPAAREFALRMRRFDPSLTAAQMTEIERGIDDLWKSGPKLHKGLTNGDAPSPGFEAGE
jgi:hypothetical protein